jgi:hypothetical protein
MPKGKKNVLTTESAPLLKELLIEFKAQGLTLKQQVPAFQKLGYGISSSRTISGWRTKFGLSDTTHASKPREEVIGNQNLGFIEDEVWKPIIMPNYNASEYQISQYGNVMGKRGHKLKWTSGGRGGLRGYPSLHLSLKDSNYTSNYAPSQEHVSATAKKIPQYVTVHTLVAQMFLPKPVPLCFSQLWPTLNKKQRNWIQQSYVVDHIDNDTMNPYVDNLRWVTVRQNNKWVKAAKDY